MRAANARPSDLIRASVRIKWLAANDGSAGGDCGPAKKLCAVSVTAVQGQARCALFGGRVMSLIDSV